MMILLLDNYDSFTFNVYQVLRGMGHSVKVLRNDQITLQGISEMNPEQIIISPGPGTPEQAGISVEVVREFAGKIPILGICLGMQAAAVALGGAVTRGRKPFHGEISAISHDGRGVFSSLPNPFKATRYHSLVVDRSTLPGDLEVTAESEDGSIMAFRHRLYSLAGVQFHPESIGTPEGAMILENFISQRECPSASKAAVRKLHKGFSLTVEESMDAMDEIASGSAPPAQIAALLTALSMKGETCQEITGFAQVMRRRARSFSVPQGVRIVDTCGTGGDGSGTFNISTTAALVAAGAGVTIAKHGNRSVTGRCGSADVLESLGVSISVPMEIMENTLAKENIAFLFAPGYHSSMKHAVSVRREIGIRTVFNILGPLVSPAGATAQIVGVFSESLLEKVGKTLLHLGTEHSLVVHGRDGLDEITLTCPTDVIEIRNGWMRRTVVDPQDFGMRYCEPADLKGGDREQNSEIVLSVLTGQNGPKRDVVVLNAAAAILVSGKAHGFEEAVDLARRSIDSGAASLKLERLAEYTGGYGGKHS